jgi:hypothetical protein
MSRTADFLTEAEEAHAQGRATPEHKKMLKAHHGKNWSAKAKKAGAEPRFGPHRQTHSQLKFARTGAKSSLERSGQDFNILGHAALPGGHAGYGRSM